ncbi:MAG TPA: thioester reductase domain-containing protein [Thermoanaerobaculia bacterium]|jgi:thioester reductase-like protein|nr:thioester reductase domain-containing protein [Thermoanaerobaculia bacterium]
MSGDSLYDVAVLGMAGRFPGAEDLDRLWDNLRRGVETVSFFTAAELATSGVDPALSSHPSYVPARGVVRDADLFDAAFFGFSPREARVLDPQQRLFLECAWEALENAACDPARAASAVGVYAGITQSTYLFRNLFANPEVMRTVSGLEIKLGNDKDFLATMVSYRLNLHGPSVNVSTACSTSLVAVHLACQGLLNRECDVALAGGVTVSFPQKVGHTYQPGGIYSADGHCRSFDAGATGSVGGDGAGVVVLKRLEDALRDGDPVRAVIKASAINNDGSRKIGFTAPSIEGQAAVISEAYGLAGIAPDTITYVEAHGSGTPLGDPVEIRALTRAFRAGTDRAGFCAVGSIKSSIGHVDAAAGVAGLIKTVLSLENRLIPPTLHSEKPNPEIPFAETPFYVASRLADWKTPEGAPRRAGVSAFGIGGTNAHVIVEEAPEREPSGPGKPWQLLVLSAAAPAALDEATDRLAAHLKSHPDEELADVAFTCQVGRRALRHRRAVVCRDRRDALTALVERDPRRLLTADDSADGRPVAFLFPGVGDHYPGMGRGLYAAEPVFRRTIDHCAEVLAPLGIDLHQALFSEEDREVVTAGPDLRRMLDPNFPLSRAVGGGWERGSGGEGANGSLTDTAILQPAVFAIEMALVALWRSWGVVPRALLGYSLGEYAAACTAGVFSLEDGLRIIAERARRIAALPAGGMLAVSLSQRELAGLLGAGIDLAAVNGPEVCVVAGPVAAIEALAGRLAQRGVTARRLPTAHAFHSAMMDPVMEDFGRFLAGIPLRPPEIPYVTNVTGGWVTAEQATDPAHWARHLRASVLFAAGLATLREEPALALLEVGPGQGLSTLALQQGDGERIAVPSLRPAWDGQDDSAFLLGSTGRLWLSGVEIDWSGMQGEVRRRKLALPTYPFQRQRYWVEPQKVVTNAAVPMAESAPAPQPSITYSRPGLRTAYVAPRDAVEEAVAAIWRDLLALEQVGIHDSFFELGGSSLLAPRLLLRVADELGAEVPLPDLLAGPTVAQLAAAVTLRRRGGGEAPPVPNTAPVLDLRAEVALDPAIRSAGDSLQNLADPRAVLLTGATGFLGAFLLRDLLAHTGAAVHCLVRADNTADARQRIERNLEAHGIAPGAAAERIVPVAGDLLAPLLGLPADAFAALAASVEAVYHAGARVNFTYPYSELRAANVGGTVELLRLAALGGGRPLHFVSSLAVFAAGSFTPEHVGLEDSDLPATNGLFSGYPQTKWVAEKILGLARERGLRSAVFRPGVIGGDSRTGIGNPRDLIWAFVKACLQLGVAPEMEGRFDPVPVDFVSRAIVELSLRGESLDRAFHFVNPRPVSWRELFAFAATLGYPLRTVAPEAWNRALEDAVRTDENNALVSFWPLLGRGSRAIPAAEEIVPAAVSERPDWRFDQRNTAAGLAGSAVVCPPVDETLLGVYFRHFMDSGFFPSPGEGCEESLR